MIDSELTSDPSLPLDTARERERTETREWLASLDEVVRRGGLARARRLLAQLERRGAVHGVAGSSPWSTPYVNTIPRRLEPAYPGDRELERRIESIVRWNAVAMVVRADREEPGIGGHLSTFASAATLFEVAFNHFLRGRDDGRGGDQVYFQGHASPGIYARAFLEGRLTEEQLVNFRRELLPGGGLPSYPHPWLMPAFWEFPTVSMGLSPLMAIYQARFNRYLEARGLARDTGRVWAFVGDGEMDEPESVAALGLAGRETLDNLVFVVNCNLQRLDGPVRGNGKIIQELEALFRGAGWNVIKVIWAGDWDELLERDEDGLLVERMETAVDGDYQKYVVADGGHIREHFFGTDPRLARLVHHLSDDQLRKLQRGGHDPHKVYAAYQAAVSHRGAPTVVLAKTIKGYGLGAAGEGRNVTHQQKKLDEEQLRELRTRFQVPIADEEIARVPFCRPPEDSPEMVYLLARRRALGGFVPSRRSPAVSLGPPSPDAFADLVGGSGDRAVSTTMAMVRLLTRLLKDPQLAKRIVPIIPDESRTFGAEPLFRQVGIYSAVGQRYEPVDKDTLLAYREARDGQLLEEGITEAGALASFIAAGTAYATHGLPMVPFFMFYSMFGFQRVGDLIWAAGDMRCRGFLIGGTAGRTTLAGEGLQHQDGHSHLLAYPYPTVLAYDPAFAFEVAVVVEEGLRQMLEERRDVIYYLTLGNEPRPMPPMPEGVREGILRGLYCFRRSSLPESEAHAHLVASGMLVHEALRAQEILESRHGVAAHVWSATSWKRLFDDSIETERWNRLHPREPPRIPHVREALARDPGVVVAVSDYTQALPASVGRWVPAEMVTLGTQGFGRSDGRKALRDFFEVSAEQIAFAALGALAGGRGFRPEMLEAARQELGIDSERPPPWQR